MDLFDEITKKINNGTVTCEDFDRLIAENVATSVDEKIRRRVQRNATKSHIDRKGHQPLGPNFTSRVVPKRKPSNNQKLNGRGEIGRQHSADAVRSMYEEKEEKPVEAKNNPEYYDEAKKVAKSLDKDLISYLMKHNLLDTNFAHAVLKEISNE